ncbi:hypothetical protein [Stenotrophomonas maltophilia]|nr:hypothetical protein [Stenotrophomonas maltophilia]
MDERISIALNLRSTGEIVLDGDHSPGTSTGIPFDVAGLTSERVSVGIYRVHGGGIGLPEGWRASVFRDENDEPTVRLSIAPGSGYIEYRCTDRTSGEPKDIVYMLTVRVTVVVDLPQVLPADADGRKEVSLQ